MSKSNIGIQISEADLSRVTGGGPTVYTDQNNEYKIDLKPLWETAKYVGKKLKKLLGF